MRNVTLALASLVVLTACSTAPNDGYTQTRAGANGGSTISYMDARQKCLIEGGAPMSGVSDRPAARQEAFDRCMRANGWEDLRTLF